MLKKWDDIPEFMRCDEVREYYDILSGKRIQLAIKRTMDIVLAVTLIIVLLIPMLVISAMIKIDSPGKVLFRQERVTAYGKRFYIHKFRTMVTNANNNGTSVTVCHDARITKVGAKLRNRRLDELPQLMDVLVGNMTFVGTRAEVPQYVDKYTREMCATLLLPAGVTSEASICFKDESELLTEADEADTVYIDRILPEKMRINLDSLRRFSLISDIRTLVRTITSV